MRYDVDERTKARLLNDYTYHPPKGDQTNRYGMIREAGRDFAFLLVQCCPPSRELSIALSSLEDVVMKANAAIARNE